MTRNFLFKACLGIVSCNAGLQSLQAQKDAGAPNIVIVVADDLGWGDVGFHGGDVITPNLDRLAGQSILMNRFYTAPISSPTRAGLMTGRYPNRFGFRTAVLPPWREDGLDEKEETIADVLGQAGYKNRAIIGKWHLGHARKAFHPMNRGFTHFYGHLNGAIDYFTHEREGELDWHKDWETCYDKGYSTDLITDEAVRCIDKYRKDGAFFLYVAYNAPHTPYQAKSEDIAIYTDHFDRLTPKEQKEVTYKAIISCMDTGIGRIYEALEKSGELDNTIFLFFSDNGGVSQKHSGELRGNKFQEWDGGVRAPAFISWKNGFRKGGCVLEQVTGFVDVLPTIREIVGIKEAPARELDGISVLSVLKGDKDYIPRDFYLGCGAVVNQDWKLILPGKNGAMKLQEPYLVDYRKKDLERENHAPGNEDKVRQLSRVALKYDTITPAYPEVPYGKGKENFVAPKEWKVTKP